MKFIVKVLEVQGINKKIYKAGDNVTTDNFPQGVAEELAKKGYLIEDEKKSVARQPEVIKKAEKKPE